MEEENFDVYEITEIEEEHIVIDDDEDDVVNTSSIRYTCEVCFLSFDSRNNKSKHFKIHKGEKLFKCEFCKKAYQKERDLQDHVNIKHTQMYPKHKCNRCSNSFTRKKDFKDHRIHCINTKGETQTFKCEKCDKIYASLLFLKVHMKKHS